MTSCRSWRIHGGLGRGATPEGCCQQGLTGGLAAQTRGPWAWPLPQGMPAVPGHGGHETTPQPAPVCRHARALARMWRGGCKKAVTPCSLTLSSTFFPCLFPTDQPPSPGGKGAYASGAAAKITSVSTGNLCTEVRAIRLSPGFSLTVRGIFTQEISVGYNFLSLQNFDLVFCERHAECVYLVVPFPSAYSKQDWAAEPGSVELLLGFPRVGKGPRA